MWIIDGNAVQGHSFKKLLDTKYSRFTYMYMYMHVYAYHLSLALLTFFPLVFAMAFLKTRAGSLSHDQPTLHCQQPGVECIHMTYQSN